MKAIDKLVGIIEGINSDGVINQKEIEQLQCWLDDNYELKEDPVCFNIFNMMQNILEDNKINESEKELLLDFTNDYLTLHATQLELINTLKGIIMGISCDNLINEREAHALKRWLKRHHYLSGIEIFDKIYVLVERVLADNVITIDEQEQLLNIFDEFISADNPEVAEKVLENTDITIRSSVNQVYDKYCNEMLINSFLERKDKTIYVIKGVGNYKNLHFDIPQLYVFQINEILALDKYDEIPVIEDILLRISGGKSYVISYEEFCILPTAIKSIINSYKYKIQIINNNLFHNYYPLLSNLNKKTVLKKLELEQDTMSDKIWEDYIVFNDKKCGFFF